MPRCTVIGNNVEVARLLGQQLEHGKLATTHVVSEDEFLEEPVETFPYDIAVIDYDGLHHSQKEELAKILAKSPSGPPVIIVHTGEVEFGFAPPNAVTLKKPVSMKSLHSTVKRLAANVLIDA